MTENVTQLDDYRKVKASTDPAAYIPCPCGCNALFISLDGDVVCLECREFMEDLYVTDSPIEFIPA